MENSEFSVGLLFVKVLLEGFELAASEYAALPPCAQEARAVAYELHESGRKVDCLDFLIRNLEKEMKQTN